MKTFLVIVAAVLGLVGGGLAWLGVFSAVAVEERAAGPYQFVYVQEASSDFGRIGELTAQLGERLEQAGFTNRKPAQVYFPIGRGIQNQIGFIVDRAATQEMLAPEEFYRVVPEQRCLAARLPFRFAASFIVGHFKVDRAFREHRRARKYAETNVMVILEGDHILYLQPIEPG